jgi:hypothetical protein
MDPYLEDSDFWHSLHTHLVIEICKDLQPQLVPGFVASAEERVVLGPLEQDILPDINVREKPYPAGSSIAVLERAESAVDIAVPQEIVVPDLTVPHRYVTIRDTRSHEVVTIIEVLSPWNKVGSGRTQYQQKQTEILLSGTNLVEIDLLRRGQHTVALPEARAPRSDYRICIHRARSNRFGYLPLSVRDPLPSLPVPLRDGMPDVVLHLGEVFQRCFDGGAFGYKIDYRRDPVPPLGPEDADWARAVLEACELATG